MPNKLKNISITHCDLLKQSFFLSVLSLIMMVVVRYISKVLVWILTILVIIGSIGNLQMEHCVLLDVFVFASGLFLL